MPTIQEVEPNVLSQTVWGRKENAFTAIGLTIDKGAAILIFGITKRSRVTKPADIPMI